MSDDEFAMLKRLVEERDRDAAHATVAPVDTAQYRSPRSLNPQITSDVCVHIEKNEAGMMNPEQDQLESPSVGTGLKAPGQQCPPNGETWETERTIADGYLLVVMGSNQGGTRWHASQYSYDTIKFIKHHFPEGKPQRVKTTKRTCNLIPKRNEKSHRLGMRL